jgi:hypothetical protein
MSESTHLKLPYLAASQAQKHVTVNEGLAKLDILVQCAIIELYRNDPPATPADGDRYITGDEPTGAWADKPFTLATYVDGVWVFHEPKPGWRVYNLADDTLYVLDASFAWVKVGLPDSGAEIQNVALLGLGTTADASNPFSAKLNASLWTARYAGEGGSGDLFYTMNKEAAGGDLGYVFQTDFVTKALVGLFGSDRFRVAVSADGSAFIDGFIVDNETGIVDQPRLPRFKGYTNFDNYVAVDTWTRIAINNTEYNDQSAFDAGNNRFVAPVAGTYLFGASLLYKVNSSTAARMRARLVLNGTTEIRGSFGEVSGAHVSEATALWLQTMAVLDQGDTVELQGYFRAQDGYFAADHTAFWGCKVG